MGRGYRRLPTLRVGFAACLLWFGGVFAVQAVPLDLGGGAPDIAAAFIDVDYDAELQLLTASGLATDYLPDGQPGPPLETIVNGTFQLSAAIDNDGTLLGGDLTVGGILPALGFNAGVLLTGQLIELGFNPLGGDPLEFLFTVSGGDAAPLFAPVGGLILNLGAVTFPGAFSADFSNAAGAGTADTFDVSEPATLWLVLLAAAGWAARRRARWPASRA